MSEQRAEHTTNEQADATARVFGLIVLCVGLGVAYLVWPAGALDTAFGAMTVGFLVRLVAAVLIGFASVFMLVLFWL